MGKADKAIIVFKIGLPLFILIISLLVAGNVFGMVMVTREEKALRQKFPRLTTTALKLILIIQIANILSLIG